MFEEIKQFGEKPESFTVRPGAYGIIMNVQNEILVVRVNGTYHLPGGGIDEGEDEISALAREVVEETGYKVVDLHSIGKANQYYLQSKIGPLNKLGTFYSGRVGEHNIEKDIEADHLVEWVPHDELLESNMAEFQKWAVQKVLSDI